MTDNIETAIGALRAATETLASALPALKKELAAGPEFRAKFDDASRNLAEANAQLGTAARALEGVEAALIATLSVAREHAYSPKVSIESRAAMAELCKQAFLELAAAGFAISVPSVGEPLNTELHNPKGNAKSALGASEVADVISWGYRFPSGQGKLAEVLVGDGTLAAQEEDDAPPTTRTAKAGITMVLDDDAPPSKPKKKAGDTLFDHLAEAAERNAEG